MGIVSVAELIDHNGDLSATLVHKWNSVIEELKTYDIVNTIDISGVIAEKYRYDMEGLLIYLNVNRRYIYPTMRVNGFNSSREYDGSVLSIKILDNKTLFYYFEMFLS